MKSLNLRSASRLLVVVFSLFILAGLPMASTAQAAPHQAIQCPSITLNPTSGQYGTSVTVTVDTGNRSGIGGSPVIITFNPPNGPIVARGVDGPFGAFIATFPVPSTATGNYTVQASGFGTPPRFCNPLTQASFQVTCSSSSLTINPAIAHIGQIATLYGCGFHPYATVAIKSTDGAFGGVIADSLGNFTYSWRVYVHNIEGYSVVTATDVYGDTAQGLSWFIH